MTVVLVADLANEPTYDLATERAVLGNDVEVRRFLYDGDDAALVTACQEADCVLTAYVPFSATTLAALPCCKLISVAATGFDNVDLAAAAKIGISVCALHNYCTDEVADHTMLLILALARRLTEYHRQVQSERRWEYDAFSGLLRLRGRTMGIIGFGSIGRAVTVRAQAFGLHVLAADPYVDSTSVLASGVEFCDVDAIWTRADIISLHCNHTSDNDRLVDRSAFEKMAQRPMLVNVARGGLIDEPALVAALDSGQVSAAGLDVLTSETPDLQGSDLLDRPNVLLTPHMAFYSDASMAAIHSESAQNIRHFLDGNHAAVNHYVSRSYE